MTTLILYSIVFSERVKKKTKYYRAQLEFEINIYGDYFCVYP